MKVTSQIHKDAIFNRPTAQFLTCQLLRDHAALVEQQEYKALRSRMRCSHPKPAPLRPLQEQASFDPFLVEIYAPYKRQPRYFLTVLPASRRPQEREQPEASEDEKPPEPTNISLFLHFRSLLDDMARKGLDFHQIITDNFRAMKMRECGKQQLVAPLRTLRRPPPNSRGILRDISQLEERQRDFKEQLIQLGTGAELAYFDALLEQKFARPNGAKKRLREVFERLSLLFVRLIQTNV